MSASATARDQLRAFVERVERLEEEKKALSDDIRDVYAEAKGHGFDTRALRVIVRKRKLDHDERLNQEQLVEIYMVALDRRRTDAGKAKTARTPKHDRPQACAARDDSVSSEPAKPKRQRPARKPVARGAVSTVTLTRAMTARLALFCGETGEEAADVVHDALALHFDALGKRWDTDAQEWRVPDPDSINLSPACNGATIVPWIPLGRRSTVPGDPPRRPAPPPASAGADQPSPAGLRPASQIRAAEGVAAKPGGPASAATPMVPPPPEALEPVPAFLRRQQASPP